jgi:rubrerythrin
MAMLSAGELVEVALGIEKNGVVYYSSLAELSSDPSLKEAYGGLADMERKHIDIFQRLLASVSGYQYQPVHAGESDEEYQRYLEALIDSVVFIDDEVARKMARDARSPAEAIQMALGAEKDSILFYLEMRDFVSKNDRPAIDSVIKEEKSHVRELSRLKGQLVKKGD